ncbi:MAG: cytochrome c biogenesis protein CcdA [Coriobacteriia bacterium]|nr:cytochrome c biogenesis protein CcdA [Coriobacteriia bacterium]
MVSSLTSLAYPLTFLEGVISFISPCLLPLLPIYIAFFAGERTGERDSAGSRSSARRSMVGAVAFMLGFTLVFVLMGAFAGSFGRLLIGHRRLLEVICGAAIIVFGLSYLGLFKLPTRIRSSAMDGSATSKRRSPARLAFLLRSFVFGLSFSLSWTPCVGAFLGSALMLAANRASWIEGALLLLCYSLGLGLPFVLSALLIERLKASIAVLMRHQQLITRISGALLIVVGLLLVTGLFGTWVTWLGRLSW